MLISKVTKALELRTASAVVAQIYQQYGLEGDNDAVLFETFRGSMSFPNDLSLVAEPKFITAAFDNSQLVALLNDSEHQVVAYWDGSIGTSSFRLSINSTSTGFVMVSTGNPDALSRMESLLSRQFSGAGTNFYKLRTDGKDDLIRILLGIEPLFEALKFSPTAKQLSLIFGLHELHQIPDVAAICDELKIGRWSFSSLVKPKPYKGENLEEFLGESKSWCGTIGSLKKKSYTDISCNVDYAQGEVVIELSAPPDAANAENLEEKMHEVLIESGVSEELLVDEFY